MKWVCLGLNYRTAPVEVRERFAVPVHRVPEVGRELLAVEGVQGCVVLSTCNRMELYFSAEDEVHASGLRDRILEGHGLEADLSRHFYEFEGDWVARHLCRVVSGLDSMVLGETEISGQVKKAYSAALESGLTENGLNRLFQKAFSVGKKVRNQTSINEGATSVGAVAVDLAEQIFGDLTRTKVLILGAGEMSRVTAQSLRSRGASGIFVANRSYDRALELARLMDAQAIRYDNWTEYLKEIDIVIASTSAPHYIVKPEDVEPLRAARKYRSLFLIDISVPRNVAPEVAEIDEAYVYDIDTLSQLAGEARRKRELEIQHCEMIIEQEMNKIGISPQVPSLVLGTRGSALALAQANMTSEALRRRYPTMEPRLEIIRTTGDIRTDVPLARVAEASGIVDKGIFIKELESALYAGEIDVAVHSLKDMPSELDERFRLAAILPRASVRDVIVSRHGAGDLALPPGAVVATSSVRRRRQIRFLRPDVTVVDIRGNVPTRLDKLAATEGWDAILLAEAGLSRLGLTADVLRSREVPLYTTFCDPEEFLPAAGQGAVALEVRADNTRVASLLAPLNDPETEARVRAEREFLRLLGAGCSTPIGVHTSVAGSLLSLRVRVFDEGSEEGAPVADIRGEGDMSEPELLAAKLVDSLSLPVQ